jgi:phosphoribosylformylglycinamidine synthase
MSAPLLPAARVESALRRALDAAERAAVTALEDGVPLPAAGGAAAPATAGEALELPAPADLAEALLALLAVSSAAGPEARPEVVEVEPGVALALARGGVRARVDPRLGGAHAAREAAAWLACRGAAPEGAAAAVEGLAGPAAWLALHGAREACAALGVPLSVPLLAELPAALRAELAAAGEGASEPGSLAVALVGRSTGVIASGFVQDGDAVVLLGAVCGGGPVGGSAYAAVLHGVDGGPVPAVDLAREAAVLAALRAAVRAGLLSSARPVARGGLGVALAEACAATGAAVRIPFAWRKDQVLFGEEPGRVLVSLPVARLPALEALAKVHGVPSVRLGAVGGERLELQAALSVEVVELLDARRVSEAGQAGGVPDGTARA